MKGYDAVVFPREGEPVLICLEASEADADRMSWTPRGAPLPGLRRGRPAAAEPAGARPRSPDRVRVRPRRRRGEPRHAGGRPDGRRADDLPEGLVRRLSGRGRRDAAARHRARDQDRPGDRADAARERDRGRRDGVRPGADPARDARERGRGDVERLGARPRHRLQGPGRARARLLARLVRPRNPHVHGDRQPADRRARADALRDLGRARTATGATTRRTSSPASSTRATPSSSSN